MERVIGRIVEEWFLTEPALFAAYCTHTLEENPRMSVPMRCGKMRIEYNPEILRDWDRKKIEERLKYEVIRIFLGHPYQRQPFKASKAALGMASDVTLSTLYRKPDTITIPDGLKYPKGLCFEEYYTLVMAYLEEQAKQSVPPPPDSEDIAPRNGDGASDGDGSNGDDEYGQNAGDDPEANVNDMLDNIEGTMKDYGSEEEQADGNDEPDEGHGGEPSDGSGSGNGDMENGEQDQCGDIDGVAKEQAEMAELWEEDPLAQENIKEVIFRAQRSRQWGSLAGSLAGIIEASTIVRIDYRRVLSGFRASVLSSRRHLTRMVPSRRYGFEYMGSKRDFCTRLLVAIDVSGSVSDQQVSQALSIINRFFKYGVENVDVIQFDVGLRGDPVSLKKAMKAMHINGRGGTDFQAPVDYFARERYDGLIIITDGYATEPKWPSGSKGNLLWMIYDDDSFRKGDSQTLNEYLTWIASFPRSKYIILPPV